MSNNRTSNLQDRIRIILLHYSPERASQIDELLQKYTGKEQQLLDALVQSLGPEPGGPSQFVSLPHVSVPPSLRSLFSIFDNAIIYYFAEVQLYCVASHQQQQHASSSSSVPLDVFEKSCHSHILVIGDKYNYIYATTGDCIRCFPHQSIENMTVRLGCQWMMKKSFATQQASQPIDIISLKLFAPQHDIILYCPSKTKQSKVIENVLRQTYFNSTGLSLQCEAVPGGSIKFETVHRIEPEGRINEEFVAIPELPLYLEDDDQSSSALNRRLRLLHLSPYLDETNNCLPVRLDVIAPTHKKVLEAPSFEEIMRKVLDHIAKTQQFSSTSTTSSDAKHVSVLTENALVPIKRRMTSIIKDRFERETRVYSALESPPPQPRLKNEEDLHNHELKALFVFVLNDGPCRGIAQRLLCFVNQSSQQQQDQEEAIAPFKILVEQGLSKLARIKCRRAACSFVFPGNNNNNTSSSLFAEMKRKLQQKDGQNVQVSHLCQFSTSLMNSPNFLGSPDQESIILIVSDFEACDLSPFYFGDDSVDPKHVKVVVPSPSSPIFVVDKILNFGPKKLVVYVRPSSSQSSHHENIISFPPQSEETNKEVIQVSSITPYISPAQFDEDATVMKKVMSHQLEGKTSATTVSTFSLVMPFPSLLHWCRLFWDELRRCRIRVKDVEVCGLGWIKLATEPNVGALKLTSKLISKCDWIEVERSKAGGSSWVNIVDELRVSARVENADDEVLECSSRLELFKRSYVESCSSLPRRSGGAPIQPNQKFMKVIDLVLQENGKLEEFDLSFIDPPLDDYHFALVCECLLFSLEQIIPPSADEKWIENIDIKEFSIAHERDKQKLSEYCVTNVCNFIRKFTSLTYVNISYVPLDNRNESDVVKALMQLPDLETLILRGCKIGAKGFSCIVDIFSVFPSKLKTLDLEQNQLTSASMMQLCSRMENDNCVLDNLNVGFNLIEIGGLENIVATLRRTKRLSTLTYSGNPAGGRDHALQFASLIAWRCGITDLDVSSCRMGGEDGMKIADELKAKSEVKKINFSDNPIGPTLTRPRKAGSDEILRDHPAEFFSFLDVGAICVLQELVMDRCDLHEDAGQALASVLQNNNKLANLVLSNNRLASVKTGLLPTSWTDMIIHNRTLCKLQLAYNGISYLGVMKLFAAMTKNKSIQELVLDGNPLDRYPPNTAHSEVVAFLENNNSIQLLSLCDMFMKDDLLVKIGEGLRRNHSLRRLPAHNNEFTVTGITELSLHLQENTTLEFCDLKCRSLQAAGNSSYLKNVVLL